jgi:hypothetical protein
MTVVTETTAYERDDGLLVVSRTEFARDRFDYKPGQHVVFGGPTQRAGKTTLAFDLLEYVATPLLPAYVAISKPTDKVTFKRGKDLEFRVTGAWPPTPKIKDYMGEKPKGYLIYPEMRDPNTAFYNAAALTQTLINHVYADGAKGKKCILVLDDTVTKSKVLMLDREMVMILTMSGAMGVGGWFFVQKPSDAGKTALWSYPNCEHLFLSKDPVKKNRDYYNEIGGFDGTRVGHATNQLKPFQFLYLERTHGYMCVVDSK